MDTYHEADHGAGMFGNQPRAAQIMGSTKMGGVIDSTVNQPGGLYAGYPGAPVQPLPAPRRRPRR